MYALAFKVDNYEFIIKMQLLFVILKVFFSYISGHEKPSVGYTHMDENGKS